MHDLFVSLIYTIKTRRWLEILMVLEEQEHTTAEALARTMQCSKRTIFKDIKALKTYFDQTIAIFGDDQGIHFTFLAPEGYLKKKQALLIEEQSFVFIDRLLLGKKATNQELSEELAIPPATLSRLKRHCMKVLRVRYGLSIDATSNTLVGTEAAIRQLFFDFYCTLPLYPRALEEKVARFHVNKKALMSDHWGMDPVLANQWQTIAKWRVDQGYLLPEEPNDRVVQQALAKEWCLVFDDTLPEREQAALFVLSVPETAFFKPLLQQKFVRSFLPLLKGQPLLQPADCPMVQLFELLIFLLEHFFQLPQEVQVQAKQNKHPPAVYLRNQFILRYTQETRRLKHTVVLTYELCGSSALKRWIKQEVTCQFMKNGIHLIEETGHSEQTVFRQVRLTNTPINRADRSTICLPFMPSDDCIASEVRSWVSSLKEEIE